MHRIQNSAGFPIGVMKFHNEEYNDALKNGPLLLGAIWRLTTESDDKVLMGYTINAFPMIPEEVMYDRDTLIEILVYHYRKNDSSCGCGWAELGHSHAAHIADVYQMSMKSRF